jgi:hypothetical protein
MQQVLVPWVEMKLEGIQLEGADNNVYQWRGVPAKLEAFRVGKRSFEFPHCSDGVAGPDGRLELVELSCTEAELLRGITGPFPIRDLKQDEVLVQHPMGGFRVVRMMADAGDRAPVADRETLVEIRDDVRKILRWIGGGSGSNTNQPGTPQPVGSRVRS